MGTDKDVCIVEVRVVQTEATISGSVAVTEESRYISREGGVRIRGFSMGHTLHTTQYGHLVRRVLLWGSIRLPNSRAQQREGAVARELYARWCERGTTKPDPHRKGKGGEENGVGVGPKTSIFQVR